MRILAFALAVAFGVCAGWIDLHNDEVQVAVAVLFAGAFIATLVHPRSAPWLALIVGVSVPIAHLYARAVAKTLPYESTLLGTSLAFLPAALGAVAARALRKVMARR